MALIVIAGKRPLAKKKTGPQQRRRLGFAVALLISILSAGSWVALTLQSL